MNIWIITNGINHLINVDNPNRHQMFKIILMIAFALPGTFFYWYQYRNQKSLSLEVFNEINREMFFIGGFAATAIIALPMAITFRADSIVLMSISAVLLLLVTNHYWINKKSFFIHGLLPLLAIGLTLYIVLLTNTNDFKIIIICVMVVILNEYPTSYVKWFAPLPLLFYLWISAANGYETFGYDFGKILIYFVRMTVTYSLVIFGFYIAKKQSELTYLLQLTTTELRENQWKLEDVQTIKERNRIAREIHDTLGHTLTGAIIQLEAAKKIINRDPEKAGVIIEKVQRITKEGFEDVKLAIKALRPVLIEESSLTEAIKALSNKIKEDMNVEVALTMDDNIHVQDNMKVDLYRIVQESITNSIRHGKATQIDIVLNVSYDRLKLYIEDNGSGNDNISEGYGLKGIRERVKKYNGEVTFESSRTNGYRVHVFIDLVDDESH